MSFLSAREHGAKPGSGGVASAQQEVKEHEGYCCFYCSKLQNHKVAVQEIRLAAATAHSSSTAAHALSWTAAARHSLDQAASHAM
jgi:hypothetical protein